MLEKYSSHPRIVATGSETMKYIVDAAYDRGNMVIRVSLSEPNINSTAVYTQHGSMNINEKYSIAHSHVWATDCMYVRLSNLANCKFTLVLLVLGKKFVPRPHHAGVWHQS